MSFRSVILESNSIEYFKFGDVAAQTSAETRTTRVMIIKSRSRIFE